MHHLGWMRWTRSHALWSSTPVRMRNTKSGWTSTELLTSHLLRSAEFCSRVSRRISYFGSTRTLEQLIQSRRRYGSTMMLSWHVRSSWKTSRLGRWHERPPRPTWTHLEISSATSAPNVRRRLSWSSIIRTVRRLLWVIHHWTRPCGTRD